MNTLYDTEKIKLTPRFECALKELMEAQCEMMRQHEPEFAECWTWGRCEVGDLALAKGLSFEFGGDEDKPKGARFKVIPIANAGSDARRAGLAKLTDG